MKCFAFFVLLCFPAAAVVAQKPSVIKVRKPASEKCTASLLGSSGGTIGRTQLTKLAVVQVKGPCSYTIKSYKLYTVVKDRIVFEINSESDSLSVVTKQALMTLPVGGRFYIEKILVKSEISGQQISLPDIRFKVID
ncbi:MAG: hypothetical protein JST26_03430 [Bacteroidetes bacterium]|nr:hypothetical protein [Bacteroidota bacterium]